MATTARDLITELRPAICDERVLTAIAEVPRDHFVPEGLRHRAWENSALPIAARQTISQPLVVARMCELLALRGDETVLDVGTGSGYHAAVLSRLARRVVSIERHGELTRAAASSLRRARIDNVTLVAGDGSHGHPPDAPYDAINVAARGERIPPVLTDQLADGGRLVMPLAQPDERLVLVRRAGDQMHHERHEPVVFVPLVGTAWRAR